MLDNPVDNPEVDETTMNRNIYSKKFIIFTF